MFPANATVTSNKHRSMSDKRKIKKNLFIDELSEESLGLSSGDITTVITPDENAPLDIKQKQRRGRSSHVLPLGVSNQIQMRRINQRDLMKLLFLWRRRSSHIYKEIEIDLSQLRFLISQLVFFFFFLAI